MSKEQQVIGTMIDHPEWMEDFKFTENHFSGVYKKIFNTIQELNTEGKSINRVSISVRLNGVENIMNEIVGCEDQSLFLRSDYRLVAKSLLQEKTTQKLGELGLMLKDMTNEDKTPEQMIDFMQGELNKVLTTIHQGGTAVRGDIAYNEFLKDYLKVVKGDDKTPFISSGFQYLDNIFKFRSGLYILAGRPAMGKTSVGLIIGRNMAKNGYKVVIRSLEMSTHELMMRYACANVDNKDDKDDVRIYKYYGKELYDVPDRHGLSNMLVDDSNASLNDIIADTRQLRREGRCDILIIDYLSLIRTQRGERRDIEVSDITTKLKQLSKELNIPILLLAQLNRAVESRIDKKPQLSDLRESGGIEQDADVVMMIYRPMYYDIYEYNTRGGRHIEDTHSLGVLIVNKNRHGSCGEAYIEFNEDLTDAKDWNFGIVATLKDYNYTDIYYHNDNEDPLPF